MCPKLCWEFSAVTLLPVPGIEPPYYPARSPVTVCWNRCVWKWPIVCRMLDIAVSFGLFGIW